MASNGITPIVEVRYSEISLKGKNRSRYESALIREIKARPSCSRERIERLPGRITITVEDLSAAMDIAPRVAKIFGVRWAGVGYSLPRDLELLKKLVVEVVKDTGKVTFKIEARRVDKTFPMTSLDLERELGEHVRTSTGIRVDLNNPQVKIHVSILRDRFLVTWLTYQGPDGLPIGVTGKVLSLLSGGIDSPVASWLMMKRGCSVDFLHFYALPGIEDVRSSKFYLLCKRLKEFSPSSKVYLSPFSTFLKYAVNADPRLELVLFRRYMLLVAEGICKRKGMLGIVTGDSLGQVASQTLENIHASSYGVSIPIYRPLIGMNKEEIVELAKSIGTYELSIADYKDCCSIVSKSPKVRCSVEEVLREWEALGMDRCVEEALEDIEELEVEIAEEVGNG